MESIIQNLSWQNLINIFSSAKERIVIIMPAIHEEWVEVISRLHTAGSIELWICFDNQESAFRSGYGDIKSIYRLESMNATIKQCKDLRLGFLGIDNIGYALNMESRIIAGNPEGPNAIKFEEELSQKILESFFPEKFLKDPDRNPVLPIRDLSQDELNEVNQKLEKNPPAEPDLQRQISTYNTLFQFVELHFSGGNLSAKTITIPTNALPFKSAELKERITTRLNLFTKEITKDWNELSEIKKHLDLIRKQYLVPCSLRKDKCVLKKARKEAFQKEIVEIKKLASDNMKKLQDKIQTAINNSEDTLKTELTDFFIINQPDSVKGLSPENATRQLNREISLILSKIKLPNAADLISRISLDTHYYELTVEDLRDAQFINWFWKKGLITNDDENALAKFSNAYEIRK